MAVTNPVNGFRGIPPKIHRDPLTCRVTKVDAAGIWAVPLGGDMRHPIGPCRGTAAVDDVVLVVWTQELPWALT